MSDAAVVRSDVAYTPGEVETMKAVAPLVAQIRDRSLWDAYARKAAGRIGVDLEVMRREVMAARRQMHVRDEDAYAPKRRFDREERRVEPGTNPYANPAARTNLESRDAAEKASLKIDDAGYSAQTQ